MKTNILNYINKLQGYKTAIKNLHWSSKHMSEHKLLDDIATTVSDNQDEIAEMCQGLYGKIKINELKPKRYKITNSKKMLYDLLRDTKTFYSSLKGRDLSGVRSVVETFIGEINKFVYLMDMCIKEDIKRNLKSPINESKDKMTIVESELRETIQLALNNVLKENISSTQLNDFMEKFDDEFQYEIYSIESSLNEFKNEVEIYKNTISQIVEIMKQYNDNGNVEIETGYYFTDITIHVELPIQRIQSDEEFEQIENEIWYELEPFSKKIPLSFKIETEPTNGKDTIYVHIQIDELPKFTYSNER